MKAKVGHWVYRKSDCWHKSRVTTFAEEVLKPNSASTHCPVVGITVVGIAVVGTATASRSDCLPQLWCFKLCAIFWNTMVIITAIIIIIIILISMYN